MPVLRTQLQKLQEAGFFRYLAPLCPPGTSGVTDPHLLDFFNSALPDVPFSAEPLERHSHSALILDARTDAAPSSDTDARFARPVVSLYTEAIAAYIAGSPTLTLPARPETAGYYILSTPRSGSTFLCDLLTSAGCMGTPGEHLKPWLGDLLVAANRPLPPLLAAIRRYSATSNGVFGSKFIIDDMFFFLSSFSDTIRSELSQSTVFLLLRGDKSQQALSNVRANALSLYHVYKDDKKSGQILKTQFAPDLDEVFQMERWLLRQEADLIELLETWGVRPKVLSFEALAQSRHMAKAVLNEMAHTLGVGVDHGYSWPNLVRIGAAMTPAPLNRYVSFRSGISLYSMRSEPSLADILLDGWCPPERWGVRTKNGDATLAIRHYEVPQFVEFLFRRTANTPHSVTVNGLALATSQCDPKTWRWIVELDQTSRDSKIVHICQDYGDIALEEVVFYSTAPPAVMEGFHSDHVILTN